MKNFIISFLALVAICVLPACTTKFNVAAPYQNITVIYGLLDRTDTAHYIRIQKAFLDQNKSALTMAQVADSNFYSNINVKIERLDFQFNLFDTIHLNKVNLDSEGYLKQPGVFFNSPNYAYKFKGTLDPGLIYRIIVTNIGTGASDSADAPIIDDSDNVANTSLNSLYITLLDYFSATATQMDFSNTGANETNPVRGTYNAPSNFLFEGYSSPAYLVQGTIRFNWHDSLAPGGPKTAHYYDYNLGNTYITSGAFSYSLKNADVFNALATGLGTAGTNIYRLMDPCTLTIYVGTPDFNTYISIEATQGTGLTGNEIQPIFTNIQGKNALGLYTSKGVRSGLFTLANRTIAALIDSPITANARVVGTNY